MKKLLGYFGSLLLIGTPALTTVSCNRTKPNETGKNNENNNQEDNKIDSGFENEDELSVQEKEILKNTGFFTKLLLLSRHENINFNANEVLNAIFSPKTTWNAFPRIYDLNGKRYDLTEYTDKLTTQYSNLGKLNATFFESFLPSNYVGMYEDKLYTEYVKSEFKEKDAVKVAFDYIDEKNNPIVKLSNNEQRKQLAWANFTGPLSKYIADNDLFTYDNGHDDRTTYGRFLDELNSKSHPPTKLEFTTNNAIKLKDGLNLKENISDSFGGLQQSVYSKQVESNFLSKILDFMPFIQNFNQTSSGAIYGLRLLNSIFPFMDTFSNQDAVYVIFFALKSACKWLNFFVNKPKRKKIENYKATKINELWNRIESDLNANGTDFQKLLETQGREYFKVQSLMSEDGKSVFDTLKQFVVTANESFNFWNDVDKKEFKKHILSQIEAYKMLLPSLVPSNIPLKEIFGKSIEF